MSVCLDEQDLAKIGPQSLTETEFVHEDRLTNRAYGDEQYSHSSDAHSLHHSPCLHIRTTCSVNSHACCFGHRDRLLYQTYVYHTHIAHNRILKDGSERDAGILHGNKTGRIKHVVRRRPSSDEDSHLYDHRHGYSVLCGQHSMHPWAMLLTEHGTLA